ncbi:neural Wiskott-Aldrich syndrome protein-like [Vespa crabro]|uniref:neural Wiskott-Aldrich syndrome protein-like n=1 Tax=Vespa crabro TaxID=7445 RepID=UPI001F02A804|nr:neural Wiskott-Aldrich syndrome protein-like [Vespa crabro]XP_046824517.1 neural Wiskott-Aldrich syndrome protein-like [Vespa crabro]
MKSGTTDKNTGSILLKTEENEQVFQLIGNRCQCLAAGIIQLYLTEPPFHKEWVKKNTGIITLIRDNPRRSFFLRLYCLQRRAMLWEHEVYNSMDYKTPLVYFHTFEAEECMAAFNFANEVEAITLRDILLDKLNAKRQKRQEKRSKMEMETQQLVTLPRKSRSSTSSFAFTTGATSNTLNGQTTVGVNRSASSSSMYKSKKKKGDKDSRRKLTKDDISLPSNFRHIVHMGWNAENKGLEFDAVNPELKKFFDMVGVSEHQLRDQETREFIYNFIESHGGMNAVKEVVLPSTKSRNTSQPPVLPQRQEYPPPVPARTITTRSAPPLPPTRFNTPITSPNTSSTAPPVHRSAPSRPPPPSVTPAPSLPPPPPPPPPSSAPTPPSRNISSGPVPPPPPLPNSIDMDIAKVNANATNNNNEEITDLRPMLMESIRSGGTTLRKVSKTETKPPPVNDSRSDLLEQIRQGIELRPVPNEVKSTPPPACQGTSLASALTRALAERSRAIHSESDESTSDTSEDDDWDD